MATKKRPILIRVQPYNYEKLKFILQNEIKTKYNENKTKLY